MLKMISLMACCTVQPHSVQEQVPVSFVHRIKNVQMIQQIPDFESIHGKFVPQLLQELGSDIAQLCWTNPADMRAQFINRYMNAIVMRLAELPEDERSESVEYVKTLIPASHEEYNYIFGYVTGAPPHSLRIGESQLPRNNNSICWPLKHSEIQQKIAEIKAQLKNNSSNIR